ncbi:DUF2170 family protein [Chitinibacter sp. FCG-7]|uniref:DUF2170 family protein n=1 Tax=Chitinibacter mangrovi TaxID=3153927 RepID=A0AAU7F9L4_9NEIS
METELDQRIKAVATGLEATLGAVEVERITGDVPVFKLTVTGREELPMFVTQAQSQLLCICYLWTEADIAAARRTALLEAMLDLNVAIPLSSFGRIGDKYVLHGALACDAGVDDLTQDLLALSDNAVDALVAMADYLV